MSEQSASPPLACTHLDGEMHDVLAVQSCDAARYLQGASPKLILVFDALPWFDAAAQIACDEFADAEANFGGAGTRAQVRHDEINVCDKFVHLRVVLMDVGGCPNL